MSSALVAPLDRVETNGPAGQCEYEIDKLLTYCFCCYLSWRKY